MLRSIKHTFGYPIEAVDGSIGKTKDFLFDDRHWRLRYIVVDTGKWLPGRKVLISPLHAKQPELGWQGKHFPVNLTKEQIEKAPDLREDAPVSAQYEEEYARHYEPMTPYWLGPYAWGMAQDPVYYPNATTNQIRSEADEQAHQYKMKKIEHSHLRSADEIIGYNIEAKDDSFGHVEDFILDDEKWKLQYLVVDTKNWLPGKKRLVDISWIDEFNWQDSKASVSLLRKQIESAPEFNPKEPINRDYEERLYDYYGRPYHWDEPHVMTPPY